MITACAQSGHGVLYVVCDWVAFEGSRFGMDVMDWHLSPWCLCLGG